VRSNEFFGIVKRYEDYIIRFNGKDFEDNDYANICKNNLDEPHPTIELLYKLNSLAVQESHWKWDKCECQPANPNDHSAFINFDHFDSDSKLTIKVGFRETSQDSDQTGEEIGLKLNVKLIENLEIDESLTCELADFSFDENKIKEYKTYNDGIPYKLIPDGLENLVYFKQGKTAYYYENLNITSYSISQNTQNSDILNTIKTEF